MRTVYWLAKEYIATEKYNSLMNLLKLQARCKDIENLNVTKNASYNTELSSYGKEKRKGGFSRNEL